MKQTIGAILVLLGYLAMVVAFISGIGYGLWLMSTGIAFGVAAWSGFLLWAQLLGGGFVSMLVGGILGVK